MSDQPLSERVFEELQNSDCWCEKCRDHAAEVRNEIAALEQERDKLRRVSEARYETEHAAANRWQERYEAMKRIADAYHARLEGGKDE